MASVRGLTPEAIKALIEDSKRDYKVVRESLTTMYRRYEGLDSDLDHLSRRMDSLPDELKGSLDSLVDLDEVLEAAREEVDSLRQRFPIQSVDIADDAITANKIEAGAITALQIAAGAVTTEKLAAGAVVAEKIDAEAVTAEKLAADSVTAGSIAADSVLTRHIGTEQVTAEKLKAGSVEADKIAAGAVTSDSIAAGSITADNIEAGAFKLRPNSILPDSAFGNFPPKNSTATAENPMPGLSKDVHGYRPEETDGLVYTPFSRPVEISTYGRYSLDMDVYLDSTQQQFNGVYVLLAVEGVDDEELVVKVTGTIDGDDAGHVGAEVIPTPFDQDAPSGFPVGTSFIALSASPGSDYKYDHTNIKIDFELVSSEGLKTLKVHGFTPIVRGILTRFDILAHAPTMKDLEDAQRATQIHADNLSESINELTQRLTAANRELSEIRREVSTPTSFMLTHPARPSRNGVSITNKYIGSNNQYILQNDSPHTMAYASAIAASHGTKSSDVVWSGVVQPQSFANIGPYVEGAPVSAFVEPDKGEGTKGGAFEFTITESDYKDAGVLPIYERTVAVLKSEEIYSRVSVSVDAVVPQVGSGALSTKVRTYIDYVVVNVTPSWNAPERRSEHNIAQHEQRAGSFGTHRYDVAYSISYDGDLPSETANLNGNYLLTVGLIASNNAGKLVGTTFKGGYTFYK